MAEKTEKATPKKLKDARKKGQVAKSKDFPSAFTFIVSIAGILASSDYLYQKLAGYTIAMFTAVKDTSDFSSKVGAYVNYAVDTIYKTSIPIMALVTVIGVTINFLIIGPMFSLESMKPDIKKLNPITNLKNMFKIKTAVELIKSILKITGALVLIYSVVSGALDQVIATAALPPLATALVFNDLLVKVVIRVGIFFIAIAVFDLVFQKKNFAKEMKMEKFEVKQEYKDTEGDPHIKSKRRQKAQEIAYQEGPQAARRAKMVVTNPTTLAIAIEYDPETQPAPKIATMGKDMRAEEIIQIALDNNIPIMRNIALAHKLYYECDIGRFVPEETYETIAEILKWIEELEKEKEQEENMLDIFKS